MVKKVSALYYEPNSIIPHYLLSHTEREILFIKLNKSYTINPITKIKHYFISNKDIRRLFKNLLRSFHRHYKDTNDINNINNLLSNIIKDRLNNINII